MPGSGFDNSRAKLNYSEQTILDKKQGLLNSSVVSQEYYYNRDPKNDLLNVDYKMQSSSNFKLGNIPIFSIIYTTVVKNEFFGMNLNLF